MLTEIAVVIGYLLLIAYYRYVSISIIDSEDTSSTGARIAFLVLNGIILFAYWGYKLYTYYTNANTTTATTTGEVNSILGKDNFIFILAMAIYLSVVLGSFTNLGFQTFAIICSVLVAMVVVPIIYKAIFNKAVGTPASPTGGLFGDTLYPFYTSPVFLVLAIMISMGVIFGTVKKFNIPNLGTWQLWATVASIIFGIKYILLYRFSSSNLFLIFGLLAVLAVLTFLMIQPTHINQSTLTLIFSVACILFAAIIPNDIPYLSFGVFMGSIAAAVALGLFTQRINASTVGVLFGLCAVYITIHFSNFLSTNKTISEKVGDLPDQGKVIALYFIASALVSILYCTDFASNTNKNLNTATIVMTAVLFLIPPFIFGGLSRLFGDNGLLGKKLTEGSWIGILISFVGMLLISYYLLSSAYSAHLNYSIVFLILFFMVGSFVLMAYNLKNILNLVLFFVVALLPILFIYLLKNSMVGASVDNSGIEKGGPLLHVKSPGMIIGGLFLVLVWIAVSVLFWSSSGLTFDALLNMNVLTITLGGFLVYLIFYYAYITFTSKSSISQKFSQIVLIIMCSYLFLQIFKKSKMATNPFISFFINVIEYIPCLYDSAVTRVMNYKPDERLKEDFTYHSGGTMIISGIVICGVLYYLYPTLSKWFSETTHTPGINLVGNEPLSTNETHMIKTYEELTKNPEKPLYNYGISFYLYINPSAGNDTFYKVVNFSGNLFITYNTVQNQLYIYALNDSGSEEPPEVALYRYNQFPLQKWVKIEINYVGGIYDVFVDNKIKTSNKVVSYNSHSNIFVGEAGSSVVGKVRDFMYYEKPLTLNQIQKTK